MWRSDCVQEAALTMQNAKVKMQTEIDMIVRVNARRFAPA
jgi:hypothetical protein